MPRGRGMTSVQLRCPIRRHARIMRIRLTAIITGILGLLSLLLFVRVPGSGAWLRASLDTSHGPIFAGVAILLAILLERGAGQAVWPDWTRLGRALALSVALGGLIELLQYFQDRPPSLGDVATDAAGAVAGLAAWAFVTRPRSEAERPAARAAMRTVITLGLAGIAFVLWRPLQAGVAYAQRASSFPVIADFRGPADLYFVGAVGAVVDIAEMPGRWTTQPGERALEVRDDGESPGPVLLIEPDEDWRGYTTLALDVTNPTQDALSLSVVMLDEEAYWSRREPGRARMPIPPATRTTVRVPLDAITKGQARQSVDLGRMASLRLAVGDTAGAAGFYLSRIWLE